MDTQPLSGSYPLCLWVHPPFISPPPSFSSFIVKTVCESCIKGSHVSCILMKWEVRYKWTGPRNEMWRWPMRRNESRLWCQGGEKSVFHKTRREIKSFSDILYLPFSLSFLPHQPNPPPDSSHPPLQSESRFGSSTHKTLRWGLSLMPSTRWHMACITCNGHSAQAIR